MPDKGHCKHSDYGICILKDDEKYGEKCIGYDYCNNYEENE